MSLDPEIAVRMAVQKSSQPLTARGAIVFQRTIILVILSGILVIFPTILLISPLPQRQLPDAGFRRRT